jgi:hypothetical protein
MMETNLQAFKNLTISDIRALGVFFGIALLCSLYFVSGILVTKVSSSTDTFALAPDGAGYTVAVLGLRTYDSAELLRSALVDERKIRALVEPDPGNIGYLVKIGPFLRREAAEILTNELQNSGYDHVKIIEYCPPGNNCVTGQPDSGVIQRVQYQ